MKGKNSLSLNKAEVIRAIEYYLNKVQFKEQVVVSNVTEDSSRRVFTITLEGGGEAEESQT